MTDTMIRKGWHAGVKLEKRKCAPFAEVFSQIRVGGYTVADENMIELERTILRPPPKQLKHNKHSEGCACTLG